MNIKIIGRVVLVGFREDDMPNLNKIAFTRYSWREGGRSGYSWPLNRMSLGYKIIWADDKIRSNRDIEEVLNNLALKGCA